MANAVSVVVPVRRDGPGLARLVEALRQQRVVGELEIVLVDCGSVPGTVTRVRDRVSRVVNLAPGMDGPGLAWNVGITASRGDVVVLLAQNVLPTPADWLSTLVAFPQFDETIAGAFAKRRPGRKATPALRRRLKRQPTLPDSVRVTGLDRPDGFETLTPAERFERCAFDSACGCIRRSVWRQHPFRDVPVAEDLEWARDVLLAGYRLAYVPSVVIRHSRNRSALEEFRRTRVLHERLFELFELRTTPSVTRLVGAVVDSAAQHALLEIPTPSRLPRSLGLALAWPLGEYLGATSAARSRGRRPGAPPAARAV